jgi:hypothetical protein
MIPARPFPVLCPPDDCPRAVTWSSLDPEHAERVHGQTLAQLAKRGGLTPAEIFGNVRRVPLKQYGRIDAAEAIDLVKRIAHHGDR